jgi:hypothetical protein
MSNPWVLSALWVGLALVATGLTFGTISALSGLNHQIITQAQYSFLVGAIIASAVLPTLVANTFFLPKHLLPRKADHAKPKAPVQVCPAFEEEV